MPKSNTPEQINYNILESVYEEFFDWYNMPWE